MTCDVWYAQPRRQAGQGQGARQAEGKSKAQSRRSRYVIEVLNLNGCETESEREGGTVPLVFAEPKDAPCTKPSHWAIIR